VGRGGREGHMDVMEGRTGKKGPLLSSGSLTRTHTHTHTHTPQVLDEPAAQQSDPTVLMLQLRTHSKEAGGSKTDMIGRIDHRRAEGGGEGAGQ
jgi:hypothetical protein